jgi:hypothetical protein
LCGRPSHAIPGQILTQSHAGSPEILLVSGKRASQRWQQGARGQKMGKGQQLDIVFDTIVQTGILGLFRFAGTAVSSS